MNNMQRRLLPVGIFLAIIVSGLAACGGQPSAGAETDPPPRATMAPLVQPTRAAMPAVSQNIQLGVSGIGRVEAIRDADLFFSVNGTVAEVLVKEGDQVKQDDMLAILDVRPFDQRIVQAEAALADALARQAALTEPPEAYDVASAQAQVAQAQAALVELRAGPKDQDVQNARSRLDQAYINLQSTRDRLSSAKTSANLQIEQVANQVRDQQAAYSQIYWDNRELENELARGGDELPQENKDREEAALRAVTVAEQQLEQAYLTYEQAQQAEVTGIQEAEEAVVQAQAALDKLLLPPDADDLAAAEAALVRAQADLDRLTPHPTASDFARAAAAVNQAQSQVEVARLDRGYAELRAPFAGVVSIVNIDPGDPGGSAGEPVIQVLDISALLIKVDITDTDIAGVAIGQKAVVFIEALPGSDFSGRVSYIAPSARVTGNVRTYEVQIALDNTDGLRDGMSARVELVNE